MNKILEYQRLEGELINIDKKIINSNAMKMIDQESEKSNSARNEMKQLDKRAGELIASFQKLQGIMKTNIQNIERLEKQKVEVSDREKLKQVYDNIKKVNDNLNIIEQRLNNINKDIDYVLKKFKRVKEVADSSRTKKMQAQSQVDQMKENATIQKEKLQQQMRNIEKTIEPKLFENYLKARKENVFPVYVQAIEEKDGMRCGGCKSVLPVSITGKLKDNGFVECEECRRTIYIKK